MTTRQKLAEFYASGITIKDLRQTARLRMCGFGWELVVIGQNVNISPKGKNQWRKVNPSAVTVMVGKIYSDMCLMPPAQFEESDYDSEPTNSNLRLARRTSTEKMSMNNFEWTSPLTCEEECALSGYKDDTWQSINPCLRAETISNDVHEKVQLIDQAIAKGRCTAPTTLYRGTGTSWLKNKGDILQPGLAFLSTSLHEKYIGQFFDVQSPAMLIINCPPHTSMAVFKHDDGQGEENECLLSRGMRFRIIAEKAVKNGRDITKPEGPFNHCYNQIGTGVTIKVYTLEPF